MVSEKRQPGQVAVWSGSLEDVSLSFSRTTCGTQSMLGDGQMCGQY